jgi:hypothetical protein
MALDASHSDVLKMVTADGLKPIPLGVGIGFAAALALGRVVALLLVSVGVLATVVPAYRATRVESL